MINRSKLGVISIIALLLLSLSVSLVAAQYSTQKTTNITIGSDGTFSASEPYVGVTYTIVGTPGATGTVTAAVYNGNPQPLADIPNGVALSHFVVVTFDMAASDFSRATLVISYTDSDVANLQAPYSIYKYVPATESFVELPSTVDTAAKTITVTLTSVDVPLLAIGGTSAAATMSEPAPTWVWMLVTVSVILAVIIVVLIILTLRRKE